MNTFTKARFGSATLLAVLLMWSCGDSEDGPSGTGPVDSSLTNLEVTWYGGTIGANLMPIVPPDPITCQVWLILENKSADRAFTKLEVPTAEVFLVRPDSLLGTIPLETDWDGYLAPAEIDTIRFFKNTGDQAIFPAPCNAQVWLNLLIGSAGGGTTVFPSLPLTFQCVF